MQEILYNTILKGNKDFNIRSKYYTNIICLCFLLDSISKIK